MVLMVIMQTILTYLELLGVFWLIKCLLREEVTRWRKWLLIIAFITIGAMTSYQRCFFLYSRWYLLVCILFCVITSCVCFQNKRKIVAVLICIYFETVYNLHLIIYMIGVITIPAKDWINEVQLKMGIEHVIIYMVADIIMVFLLYEISNHKIWISSILDKKIWPWLLIAVLEHMVLYFCDAVMGSEHMKEGLSNAREITLLSLFLILIIVIIYLRHKYEIIVNKQKEEITLYESRYDAAIKNNNERVRLYHDMSHHITAVMGYLENEEYQEALVYLKMIYPVLQVEERLKSSPVTFLMNEKINEAREKGIQVRAEHEEIWDDLKVEETRDWCALLGNLWDNAIESATLVKAHSQIDCSVTRLGKAVKILIQNSCSQKIVSGGIPKTTKKEQNIHGIGFQIILNIVDKYHGDMVWYCENNIFYVKIILTL